MTNENAFLTLLNRLQKSCIRGCRILVILKHENMTFTGSCCQVTAQNRSTKQHSNKPLKSWKWSLLRPACSIVCITLTGSYASTHTGVSSFCKPALVCFEQLVNILCVNRVKQASGERQTDLVVFLFLCKEFHFDPSTFSSPQVTSHFFFTLLKTLFQEHKHKIEITAMSSWSLDVVSMWPDITRDLLCSPVAEAAVLRGIMSQLDVT